ncbi:hypothetical protein GQX73_g6576 [Xylaria multiplex]|uniref:Heterokaryon incompatibility domain-containing protein n=1 Tax=Xylaria multiplex TaxID=323545 RepID=A0A7C8ISI1_9PEZI|nr:hypothetical protein GQX73_g6576 [Xylaria multiplex]
MDKDGYTGETYSLEHAAVLFRLTTKHFRSRLTQILPTLRDGNFLKGRKVEDILDTKLVNSWLEYCDHHHEGCEPQPLPSSSHFPIWMIDIKQRMVVTEFGNAPQFAALSYVWGSNDTKHLKYTKLGGVDVRLSTPGGLSDDHQDIPTTIKDAMILCERLSIPFLWVDALCLDQDKLQEDTSDPESFDILGMIYASAYVTIVAAGGQDSWAGLPGLNPGSRSLSNATERTSNVCFGLFNGPTGPKVSKSVWNSRAWTFQEMLLSRRILVFTNGEIFYECCSGGSHRESVVMEISRRVRNAFSSPSLDATFKFPLDILDKAVSRRDSSAEAYRVYVELISEYIHRAMSNPNDILRASQAILDALGRRTGCGLFHGILLNHFHDTLIFKVMPTHFSNRRDGFPSWSWCGWGAQSYGRKPALVFQDPMDRQWIEKAVDLYRLDPTAAKRGYSLHNKPLFVRMEGKQHETSETMKLDDYRDEWGNCLPHMLVFESRTLHIRVQRKAQSTYFVGENEGKSTTTDPNPPQGLDLFDSDSDDDIDDSSHEGDDDDNYGDGDSDGGDNRGGGNVKFGTRKVGKYQCLEPDVGMRTIELDLEWRNKAQDELEFVEIGRYGGHIKKSESIIGPKTGHERHRTPVVLALLIETDATGISRRTGLYEFNKDLWESAETTVRTIYLC